MRVSLHQPCIWLQLSLLLLANAPQRVKKPMDFSRFADAESRIFRSGIVSALWQSGHRRSRSPSSLRSCEEIEIGLAATTAINAAKRLEARTAVRRRFAIDAAGALLENRSTQRGYFDDPLCFATRDLPPPHFRSPPNRFRTWILPVGADQRSHNSALPRPPNVASPSRLTP